MHDDAIYEKPMIIIKIILLIIVIGLVIWFMAGVIKKQKSTSNQKLVYRHSLLVLQKHTKLELKV